MLFPRCSAYVYESAYGFAVHTNCHDIQAEAQREYGLTPDDVHDSFNLFMCTEVRRGRPRHHHPAGREPGDHVDLLALIGRAGGAQCLRRRRHAHQQLLAQTGEGPGAASARRETWPGARRAPSRSQRTPEDFRNPRSRPIANCARIQATTPKFLNTPLTVTDVEIELDDEELALLRGLRARALYRRGRRRHAARRLLFLVGATLRHQPQRCADGRAQRIGRRPDRIVPTEFLVISPVVKEDSHELEQSLAPPLRGQHTRRFADRRLACVARAQSGLTVGILYSARVTTTAGTSRMPWPRGR